MTDGKPRPFPSKQDVVDFIRESPGPVGKKEIARAFQISGAERIPLKEMLKEIESEGLVARGRGRRMQAAGQLPPVAVLIVHEIDPDGEVIARPLRWDEDAPIPRVFMMPERRGHPALAEGDRVLARIRRLPDGTCEGRTMRRLGEAGSPTRVVGVFRRLGESGGEVRPADKRSRTLYAVAESDRGGARDGELVAIELTPGPRAADERRAVVVDRLGDAGHPKSISLIAIHAAGIPTDFPEAALAQSAAAQVPPVDGREDLRAVPLVTIDGPDARDFDDAVWAAPDDDPQNPGGWRLIVAIADVAHYVGPDSPLDREAYRRGNSCYFPDRVVPMLPEALSNGVCSLKPDEPRACVAAHLRIDAEGKLLRHRFVRGLMRSAARLTYEQVQAARNGDPDATTGPLLGSVIAPLYGAFAALTRAREKRGTLDLDIPERIVHLDAEGHVEAIGVRPHYDSHRLIEEFMIAANVAAAQTLGRRNHPCLYRVHDQPSPAKLEALRQFLEPLGYRLAKGQVPQPRAFTQILAQAEGRPEAETVNQMILRSQAQAIYSPSNIGHFGLALPQYAHFTSPIRRYADLTVHRGLIRALGLGSGGTDDSELERLEEIGEHISFTERRAAAAERDAIDRYVAGFLEDQVGGIFAGTINGVTRFGLFVTLKDSGADGLVPIASLPDDWYRHDEKAHRLVGERWGRTYTLGEPVKVRLMEADALTGSTLLNLIEESEAEGPGEIAGSAGAGFPGTARHRHARHRQPGSAKTRRTARRRD